MRPTGSLHAFVFSGKPVSQLIYSAPQALQSFWKKVSRLLLRTRMLFSPEAEILKVFNSGSFLDPKQIPYEVQKYFAKNIAPKYKRVIIKQEFIGANKIIPEGKERLSQYSNFFYGNESSNWFNNVPIYQEIYYRNLYNGIDLRYYSNKIGLKYQVFSKLKPDEVFC